MAPQNYLSNLWSIVMIKGVEVILCCFLLCASRLEISRDDRNMLPLLQKRYFVVVVVKRKDSDQNPLIGTVRYRLTTVHTSNFRLKHMKSRLTTVHSSNSRLKHIKMSEVNVKVKL